MADGRAAIEPSVLNGCYLSGIKVPAEYALFRNGNERFAADTCVIEAQNLSPEKERG